MADQAVAMKRPSSFISRLERGLEQIPVDYVGQFSEWLELDATQTDDLIRKSQIRSKRTQTARGSSLTDSLATILNEFRLEKTSLGKEEELILGGTDAEK